MSKNQNPQADFHGDNSCHMGDSWFHQLRQVFQLLK